MIKQKTSVILLFLIALSLIFSGCKTANSGDESTEPLDKLIKGLLNKDTETYKSAFLPDYISSLTDELSVVSEDINAMISQTLSGALDAHTVNYGDDITISYKLISKVAMTKDELSEKYLDYYMVGYDLPVDEITEAYKSTIEVTVEGDDSSITKQAVYKFLKINGIWYLHPASFMNVFAG